MSFVVLLVIMSLLSSLSLDVVVMTNVESVDCRNDCSHLAEVHTPELLLYPFLDAAALSHVSGRGMMYTDVHAIRGIFHRKPCFSTN